MADEEENECCPLCMEELDITDKTFNACPCGYQARSFSESEWTPSNVCLWCWHQIKNEYNALCPACRAPYSELSKQKSPLDREDVIRRTKQRKQKEKSERRSASQSKIPTVNRRNLANVRVMQRNLVYIIGLPQSVADDDILRSNECFGQYGKIVKAVVNKSHLTADRSNATASAYITFASKEDALSCIIAVDGFYLDGSLLRASFGTTKYCNFFLRNMSCNNPDCLYLHELGEQDDSFTKDEMQSALHSGKAAFRDLSTADIRSGTRFPPPPNKPSAPGAQPRTGSGSLSSSAAAASMTGATSAAAAASNASADRQAQSAAAIHKLRQTHSTSSHSHSRPDLRRGNSYSRIVTGFATSGSSSPSSSSSSPPSSPSRSSSTPPLPPSDVDSVTARDDRKPNLRVDTSVGGGDASTSTGDSIVGPLEALKLATGSSSQEPAWAMPFPSPSIGLQHEADETSPDPVFSPFGLGFDHGLHSQSTPPAHDPWTSASSKSRSPMRHSLSDDEPLTARFSSSSSSSRFPIGLNGGGNPPNVQVSGLSGLSFASIDAIFSHRDEPSDGLAGLRGGAPLGPPQSMAPIPKTPTLAQAPLVHSSPSIGSGRSSRFAFANQPAPSPQSALRDAPSMPTRGPPPMSGGLPPASPYRSLSRHSSFRDPQSSSMFPSPNDPRAFPPLGGGVHSQPPPPPPHPPLPPRTSHVFSRSTSDPFPSSDLMGGGDSNGLAFLQQMLPNVNISYGGDFPSSAPQPPPPSSSNDGWGGGLGSLGGFNSQISGHSNSMGRDSGSSFYDPALMAAPGLSGFYGLGGEDDRLRQQQSAFGGSFRQ